ncbi:MAG: hypothetical protein AMXMBFR13_04130 [Phycisphaerae bacterium]
MYGRVAVTVQPQVSWRTLLDALDHHAQATPDRTAFIFLNDGEEESGRLTWSEVRCRSLGVARMLSDHAAAGERALLLYPPGLEFITSFLGCLYAGVIAVPLYAPHPRRPDARLVTVARDCDPRLVLSDGPTLERCAAALDGQEDLAGAERLATDENPAVASAVHPPVRPQDIAFLQYTSGSTSSPRGVCVTHENLLANERMIEQAMWLSRDTVFVSWLPTHHDMGLIGDTLQPVYLGCLSCKMPPASFLQHPRRWLAAVTRYRGTIIGSPNFGYDLCVRRIPPEERRLFDLGSLRVTYCGSEPIRAETMNGFARAFEPCGLDPKSMYPCYGMAELTLLASGGPPMRSLVALSAGAASLHRHKVRPPQADDSVTLVSCGRLAAGSDALIVDPGTLEICPPDSIGEIWISGPHVAGGYWGNRERTAEVFEARTACGKGPFLRTGDLGCLREGELYVTGRLKDIIIIRGQNLYPQDIERAAHESNPMLAGCMSAAFGVRSAGGEEIVLVQEAPRTATLEQAEQLAGQIVRSVNEQLAAGQIRVVMVRWGEVPRTSSGKVRRGACREAYLGGGLSTVQHRSRAPEAQARLLETV